MNVEIPDEVVERVATALRAWAGTLEVELDFDGLTDEQVVRKFCRKRLKRIVKGYERQQAEMAAVAAVPEPEVDL